MEKVYILVVITCKEGIITTETTVYNSLTDARVSLSEELKYQEQTAPKGTGIYDGYFGDGQYWFEVGETTENYWCRAEIQGKSINV